MLVKKTALLLFIAFTNVMAIAQSVDSCKMPALPSIYFKKGPVALSAKAKLTLDTVAVLARFFPNCKIRVSGHVNMSKESEQQVAWDKVYLAINYLTKKGIKKENFIFEYGLEGDTEIVDISGTMEDGPAMVPSPIPCYSILTPKARRCVKADGSFRHG